MSHETTRTFKFDGRFHNVTSVARRSGKKLTREQMIDRARKDGILGRGFKTKEAAVASAKKRSKSFDIPDNLRFASTRPGGRVRRRHKLEGTRKALNPGGNQPRGGGGRPRLTRKKR